VQIRQLKNAVDDNPAAIILNAVDSVSIAQALKDFGSKSVPVLVYDRMLSPEDAFDFASVSDAEEIGRMAAQKTIELLGAQLGSADHKSVLQIVGDPGDSYSLRVLRGFRTTIKAYTNINIITVPAMAWEPGNARKVAEQELKSNPKIDLVFCHSADLAAAVIPLVEPKIRANEVMVMAITGAPIGLYNLAQNLQKFEIEQPLYAQVYGLALGLRAVKNVKAGREGLKDGKCGIMGVSGIVEQGGRVLKLQGRPLDASDLKVRRKLELWGELARPIKSADEINKLACDRL
jgi:ribose transport system substrate-binding protein